MRLDVLEPHRFVESTCWIPRVDAETQGGDTSSDARVDEADEKGPSDSLVPTRRDDRDGQLGDVCGDEAVAVARLGEGPVPGSTHGTVLLGDHSVIPWP